MIEFLTENWKLIAILGAILVELVLLLVFKKRPQNNIIDNGFLMEVCKWIEEAECAYETGPEKLAFVLSKARMYLGSRYDEEVVSDIVEWVLTLPEKKEKRK